MPVGVAAMLPWAGQCTVTGRAPAGPLPGCRARPAVGVIIMMIGRGGPPGHADGYTGEPAEYASGSRLEIQVQVSGESGYNFTGKPEVA